VIDGKPSASADLIASLVRRAGHKLRVSGDDTHAVAQIIRADDPDFTYEARWDLDKARQAGLLGKGTWKNYPAALLRSRAITEVARMGASDALYGVIYTPEELGVQVDDDGAPVAEVAVLPERSGVSRLRAAVTPVEPAPAAVVVGSEPVEAEVVPDEPAPAASAAPAVNGQAVSRPQLGMLHALLADNGIDDRDAGLAYIASVLGRDVASSKDLSKREASQVIDALKALGDNTPPAVDEPVDEPDPGFFADLEAGR
jgi:hypothetical protein